MCTGDTVKASILIADTHREPGGKSARANSLGTIHKIHPALCKSAALLMWSRRCSACLAKIFQIKMRTGREGSSIHQDCLFTSYEGTLHSMGNWHFLYAAHDRAFSNRYQHLLSPPLGYAVVRTCTAMSVCHGSAVCTYLFSNSTWHCIRIRKVISCSAAMLCESMHSGSTSQKCNCLQGKWCLLFGWQSPQARRISQARPAMSREPHSSSLCGRPWLNRISTPAAPCSIIPCPQTRLHTSQARPDRLRPAG